MLLLLVVRVDELDSRIYVARQYPSGMREGAKRSFGSVAYESKGSYRLCDEAPRHGHALRTEFVTVLLQMTVRRANIAGRRDAASFRRQHEDGCF